MPREEAQHRIAAQIEKAKTVPNVGIDENDEARLWYEFTSELLRQLFTTDELCNEFTGAGSGMHGDDISTSHYLKRLISIHSRIDLYPEETAAPRPNVEINQPTTGPGRREALAERMPTTERKDEPGSPDVFISHSTLDENLASLLVNLLVKALYLRPEQIRCTSCPGHKLGAGTDINKQVRVEVIGAKVLISLITEDSLRSTYVLFELGARWGVKEKEPIIPLLVAGSKPSILREPLKSYVALNCNDKGDVHDLVDKVAEALGLRGKENKPSAYLRELEALVEASNTAGESREDQYFYRLPLDAIANQDISSLYANPPIGRLMVDYIPFTIKPKNGIFVSGRLAGLDDPPPLELATPIENVRSVYLLINAGDAHRIFFDQQVGQVKLLFSNGSQTTPLILGKNIREWAIGNSSDLVSDATEKGTNLTQAWAGLNISKRESVIDRLEIPVFQPFRAGALRQIVFSRDARTESGGPIYLVSAVTVEHFPPNVSA